MSVWLPASKLCCYVNHVSVLNYNSKSVRPSKAHDSSKSGAEHANGKIVGSKYVQYRLPTTASWSLSV